MASYYFDFVGGSDSNTGTKLSPWKRHKFMTGVTGNAAAMAHVAGDNYYFKGGVTWDHTCFPFSITSGGSSTNNRDYYGVDQTWYTGANWTRPVFDNEYVSCTSHRTTLDGGNTRVDNIEMKRLLVSSTTFAPSIITTSTSGNIISNCYIHGWRTTANADDAYGGVIVGTSNPPLDFTLDNTEVENSENTNVLTTGNSTTSATLATGSQTLAVTGALTVSAGQYVQAVSAGNNNNFLCGYVTSFSGGSLVFNATTKGGSGSAADWVIKGPYTLSGLCIRDVAIIQNGSKIHDNSSGVLYCLDFNGSYLYNISGDGYDRVYHYNGIYQDPYAWTQPNTARDSYIRNSYLSDCSNGSNMAYPNPRSGANCVMYNNVLYGAMSAQCAVEVQLDQYANSTNANFIAYNNTIANFSVGSTAFHISGYNSSKLANLVLANNHVMNAASLTDQSAGAVTAYTNTTNLTQTAAQATAQGYDLVHLYAPQSGAAGTVGIGTSGAYMTATDILGVTRILDVGAYQFAGNSVFRLGFRLIQV